MSAAGGHEPPQVPHWMHISNRETPAVLALTSSKNLRFGFESLGVRGCAVKCHLLVNQIYRLQLASARCRGGCGFHQYKNSKGFRVISWSLASFVDQKTVMPVWPEMSSVVLGLK